jgi:hypothetical protein
VADAGSWATSALPTAVLTNAAGKKGDGLGDITRASTDGMTVVASAVDAAKGAGALDVFHASGEDAWTTTSTPTTTLVEPKRKPNDLLGYGVAVSADGTTAVGGAPGVNWYTGNALVFHVADASSWGGSGHLAAKLTNSALPKPHCIVPRLKGEPLEFAKFDLEFSDCGLGKVKKVHDKKKLRGRIISQSPKPGSHRRAGFKVRVEVGK